MHNIWFESENEYPPPGNIRLRKVTLKPELELELDFWTRTWTQGRVQGQCQDLVQGQVQKVKFKRSSSM